MSDSHNDQRTIDSLLRNFRESLRAITPMFEGVDLTWREPEAYDEWDKVAVELYNSLVLSAVRPAVEEEEYLPILPYDARVESYCDKSYFSDKNNRPDNAFVCFETREVEFDTCLLAQLDPSGAVQHHISKDLDAVSFELVARRRRGAVDRVSEILI